MSVARAHTWATDTTFCHTLISNLLQAVKTLHQKSMNESVKKKILLAEDDDSMRRFVEVILQQAGFEVFAAEDGLAAMQIALETEIDALVADAIMPNLSGFDLCRMINGNPGDKKIPSIVLSGLERKSTDDSTENVADVFLMKDAKLKENLIAALAKLL